MAAFDCGFNESMQHTTQDRGGVADAAQTENPLHGESEGLDVGSLAERRLSPSHRSTV